jgi:G patch domain-containing protein 1
MANLRDSKGMVLLRKMGWKPGQGVGPRIPAAEKDDHAASDKVYGCHIPEIYRKTRDEEFLGELTFAPDDVKPWKMQPKKNLFGLGYTGLSRSSILGSGSGESKLVVRGKGDKKLAIAGQVSK